MAQLRCRDLRPGDIMVQLNTGTATHNLISFGQAMTGMHASDAIHAGVMFDSTYIVESNKHGVVASDLRVGNLPYKYFVFRCANPSVAAGAGTCAKMMFDIHATHSSASYSYLGALCSIFAGTGKPVTPTQMDELLDRILAGKDHPFFCSQFVVYVYQFVAEQCGLPGASLFNMADAKVAPSRLYTHLKGHAMFREAGYLLPKER